ncbi:hypothetical protein C8R43DRAFT_1045801 [Mycena crocata]|nr:hypothetical protein C8R43DRAFT_1045801 [Mycena crocata]
MSILNSNLISFPDDFDPSAAAFSAATPNTAAPLPMDLSAPLPDLLPEVESSAGGTAGINAIPVLTSATDGTPRVVTPGESLAPRVDPTAIAMSAAPAALPLITPTSDRSLRRQTSASFSSRSAAAAASSSSKGKDRERDGVPSRPDSPDMLRTYGDLGLTPQPSGNETAAGTRTRHENNGQIIARQVNRNRQDIASLQVVQHERFEQLARLVGDSNDVPAATSTRIDSMKAEIIELSSTLAATRTKLGAAINAVNGMRSLRAEVESLKARLSAGQPAASAVNNSLHAPIPDLLPPTQPVAGPSRQTAPPVAGPSSLVRPREEEAFSPSKRQRTAATTTTAPPRFDVYFYDVAPTGEPRDIARAALSQIPHLTPNAISNAIRVRDRTISLRFRNHALGLSFIHAIEQEPPVGLEGMHACWASSNSTVTNTVSDPIALIRGDGFTGHSG